MPRRPHNDPPVKLKIALPQSLVEQLEEKLRDPFTGKRRYGALSALIQRQLRAWLADEGAERSPKQ